MTITRNLLARALRRWAIVASLLILAAACALSTIPFARGESAPAAPSRSGPVPINTRYIPPGTYTAIVLTSNATTRRWIVSLKTTRGTFPITIGGATNVIIPFEKGWTVLAADQARIESPYVPFEDVSRRDLFDGNENLAISAWGITEQGPVEFAAPVVKP